jgi:hypothetical protein
MIAAELHALRPRFDTWEDLASELRLKGGARTLAPHKGLACKRIKVSAPLRASVEELFEREYPFPLPEYQKNIRARLISAKQKGRWKGLLEVIIEIEGIVADCAPKEPLHAAGLKYLEFLACHARAILNPTYMIFGDRIARRESLFRCISAAGEGRSIIAKALKDTPTRADSKFLAELDVWLFMNWVVAIGSYVFGDTPPDPAKLNKTLQACNAIATFKRALVDLPYEWRVPYNGLDTTSRQLAPDEDLALFYQRLVTFDPGFADFDYTPGEVLPINKNPEFKHFRERYKANPTLFATQKRSKR